ncbi:hypothetical protein L7F22_060070 [Adiantum nelumboides]|nr:hypothetical protein [Adiantum nelumboides]
MCQLCTGYVPALMAVLKASYELGYIECTQIVHSEIIEEELEKDVFFGIALVRTYTKFSLLADAQAVFDEIVDVDLILWNTLIGGYVDHGLYEEVMQCLRQMQWQALPPSPVTIVYGLRACVNAGCLGKGRELCTEVFREGFEQDPFVGSALLNMFAKCSSLIEAQDIFDDLPFPNVVLWNTLLSGYLDHGMFDEALVCYGRMKSQSLPGNPITFVCILKACANAGFLELGQDIHILSIQNDYHLNAKLSNALLEFYVRCGLLEEALDVFSEITHRDVFAWTSLVVGFAEFGCEKKALDCLELMQLDGVSPNSATYVCVLKACEGMYCKCGSMGDAQKVFNAVHRRETVIYNSLITGYACQGESAQVFGLLDRMSEEDKQPNEVTFLSILTVCSHDGLLDKGQEYLSIMVDGFDLLPSVKHHTCVVDLFCRAGQLDEAIVAMTRLPVETDTAVWSSILSACYMWRMARLAFQAWPLAME